MQIILIGYPGSQHIVPATKYLMNKYMPGFTVTFLNYEGNINDWSNYVADYLETIDDEKVIFALDDYFLEKPLNQEEFDLAMKMKSPVKLCPCSQQEQLEYPVTTQFTIWDRNQLINILRQTSSPWDFEMRGSKVLTEASLCPCLKYDVHSALSNRWQGINWGNLSEEDLKVVKELCI